MNQECTNDNQSKWKHLKYEIKKILIQHSKELAKIKRIQSRNLEVELKHLVSTKNFKARKEYIQSKNYKTINGLRLNNKFDLYKHCEKSSKIFIILKNLGLDKIKLEIFWKMERWI